MSMGPLGIIGSAAGAPLQQTKGSETERAQQETANQARQTQAEQRAERASGVEQTEQHEQAADRDADGRRLWENVEPEEDNADQTAAPEDAPASDPPESKDPTGQTGAHLDLKG
jgi:hypothetical protein